MAKITVFGENCTDRFIYSKINRLSPEAPVPVLIPIETTENPGMAGNVVKNLQALSNNIEVTHIHQSEKIEKTRFIEKKSNHMFIRVDEGELNPCSPLNILSDSDITLIKESDVVIISDYDKGFLSQEQIINIGSLSNISILDSKKKLDSNTLHHIDFIKLNESEAELNKDILALFPEKFLITLGSKGVSYNGILYSSPNPQETIDVSGAGDTFVAAFAYKYLICKNVPDSIRYANEMASIVVSKRGVATP